MMKPVKSHKYIWHGWIKGFNSSITATMCQVAMQLIKVWLGNYRMLEQYSTVDTFLSKKSNRYSIAKCIKFQWSVFVNTSLCVKYNETLKALLL